MTAFFDLLDNISDGSERLDDVSSEEIEGTIDKLSLAGGSDETVSGTKTISIPWQRKNIRTTFAHRIF